jgi:hypothetical protein
LTTSWFVAETRIKPAAEFNKGPLKNRMPPNCSMLPRRGH